MALAELSRGGVIEAIGKLKEIVRTEPGFGAANFYLSTLYTEMGEFEMAQRYLEQAMQADPKQGPYHHQLGVIRFRQKNWREALAAFEAALRLGMGKNEATVWRSIGDTQVELFDREGALRAYLNAVQIHPKDARTRMALGQFYLDRNELERAVAELKAAVELDPALPGALAALGRAHRRSGDAAAAVAILRKAVEVSPADQESRYVLGQALMEAGRSGEGRAELDHYQRVQERIALATSRFDAAAPLLESGDLEGAEKILTEAVDLAPTYGPGLLSLGVVLLDRGNYPKAAETLQRAVKANPLRAAAYFSLGAAHLALKRSADALTATRQAIVINDREPRYHRQLGEILNGMNRTEDARAAIELAERLESVK